MSAAAYEGWALLELMGHRQRVGFIKEVEMYGGKMLRIDIPLKDGSNVSEFYGCTSVYALRPISEAVAREHAKGAADPRPVAPLDFRIADQRGETDGGDTDDGEFS